MLSERQLGRGKTRVMLVSRAAGTFPAPPSIPEAQPGTAMVSQETFASLLLLEGWHLLSAEQRAEQGTCETGHPPPSCQRNERAHKPISLGNGFIIPVKTKPQRQRTGKGRGQKPFPWPVLVFETPSSRSTVIKGTVAAIPICQKTSSREEAWMNRVIGWNSGEKGECMIFGRRGRQLRRTAKM